MQITQEVVNIKHCSKQTLTYVQYIKDISVIYEVTIEII